MADFEKLDELFVRIDELTGTTEATVPEPPMPQSFGEKLSALTGLPTAVVQGNPEDTGEQAALMAARAVGHRFGTPSRIDRFASKAIAAIDSGSDESQ